LLRPVGALTYEILLVRDLTRTLPSVSAAVEATIRTATEADLGWIVKLYRDDPYLFIGTERASSASRDDQEEQIAEPNDQQAIEAYRNRFRRGEKCFVAFVGAQVAHVNWLCLSWGEEAVPGHPIILRPGEAYTTDALTLEPFRGMNIHALVLGQMLRAAQARGCQRVYTATSIDRRASFGAFRQLGWQVYGQLLCFVPKYGSRAWLIKLSGSIEPLLRSATS